MLHTQTDSVQKKINIYIYIYIYIYISSSSQAPHTGIWEGLKKSIFKELTHTYSYEGTTFYTTFHADTFTYYF